MKAMILAAGRGTRLRPFTNHLPKCLVPVNGKPILQHQLEALDQAGIQDCLIVVGYRAAQVRGRFGPQFGNVRIAYVENPWFASTNNVYSVWLACHEIDDDFLLVEGDLLFDGRLIDDVLKRPEPDVAVVAKYNATMDGTVIFAQDSAADAIVLKAEQAPGFDYRGALKTVNIYKLCLTTLGRQFFPALDRMVAAHQTDQFYEAALAQLVSDGDIHLGLHTTGTQRWTEIDTVEDLHQTEQLFRLSLQKSNRDQRFARRRPAQRNPSLRSAS